MSLHGITQELEALFDNDALFLEENLEERVEALGFLRFAKGALMSAKRTAAAQGAIVEIDTWLERLHDLQVAIEATDRRLCDSVRRWILERGQAESASDARASLRALFDRFTCYRSGQIGYLHAGYNGLDALVSGVVLEEPVPDQACVLDEEMIPYQATPASAILELVDRISFSDSDLFCDVGSGPGLVAILVNLLTGVRAWGIEIDPALCAYAQRRARRFALGNVSFAQDDARRVDLHAATVFYLFTPFTGKILQEVLARLEQQAAMQHIRICSYGPSTPVIAGEPWLVGLDTHGSDEFRLACFESARDRR